MADGRLQAVELLERKERVVVENQLWKLFRAGLLEIACELLKNVPDVYKRQAEEYYKIPKEDRVGRVQVTASSSFFVPKPFTPFQWAQMCTKDRCV